MNENNIKINKSQENISRPEALVNLEPIDVNDPEFQVAIKEFGDDWYAAEAYPEEPGPTNMKNIIYFCERDDKGKVMAIVGKYDNLELKNITHTAVRQDKRGQGLALRLKDEMAKTLSLPALVATVNTSNGSSLASLEKWGAKCLTGYENDSEITPAIVKSYSDNGKCIYRKEYSDNK